MFKGVLRQKYRDYVHATGSVAEQEKNFDRYMKNHAFFSKDGEKKARGAGKRIFYYETSKQNEQTGKREKAFAGIKLQED
jgi:hypothetical protein